MAKQLVRKLNLANRYTLPIGVYCLLARLQGGKCLGCQRRFGYEPDNRPNVDHDHGCCPEKEKSCGKCLRGLLCPKCNVNDALAGKKRANIFYPLIKYLPTCQSPAEILMISEWLLNIHYGLELPEVSK